MSPFSDDVYGNSSGVHDVSRRAKNALEDARERVAALIGARPLEIVFTSGGTESDNLALKGAVWNSNPRLGIITVATEHEAILESVDVLGRFGAATTVLGVDRDGRVDVEVLVDRLDTTTSVVSAMLVNNETGTINDVATLAHRVKEVDSEILVHTDAVQAFSTESIDVRDLGVDMLTLTAHKFGGPKGAGLLYVKEGTLLEPLLHGGGQELGRRSGTHDVAAAVGLAQAMELSVADRERFRTEIGAIRDHFEKLVTSSVDWAVVNTPEVNRSPHHFNVRFPGVRNETLLLRLDQIGLAASAGSACQSGAATVSHVLEAMGLSASEARASVRFTFGWNSTMEEGIEAAEIVTDLVASLR
jgi:cysteine desulfurase